MREVKHFVWRARDWDGKNLQGRVAVLVTDKYIRFEHIGGKRPPAKMREWYDALTAAFPALEEKAREDARWALSYPWRIEWREGMSGCETYKLRELVSHALRDQPVRARIHITMSAVLDDFLMRLGHFYLLFQESIKRPEPEKGYLFNLTIEIEGFTPPEIPETGWSPPPSLEVEDDSEDG